jgi:hypothetical protein
MRTPTLEYLKAGTHVRLGEAVDYVRPEHGFKVSPWELAKDFTNGQIRESTPVWRDAAGYISKAVVTECGHCGHTQPDRGSLHDCCQSCGGEI